MLYGTKNRVLGTEPLEQPCGRCQKSPQELSAVASYYHFFRLPLLAYRRETTLQCPHCKSATPEKEWAEPIKIASAALEKKFRVPIRLYAGLSLLTALLTTSLLGLYQHHTYQKSLFTDPQVGDVVVFHKNYVTQSTRAEYWPALIEKVTKEVVFVRPSNYAYSNWRGVDKNLRTDMQDKDDFFNEAVYSVPRDQMNGENIKEVIRE